MNTFGYVGGNPITYVDPRGEFGWMIAGAFIGGGMNIITQLNQGGDFKWRSFVSSTATGALGGGLGTLTKGLSLGWNIFWNTAGSAAIGAGVQVANNAYSGCDLDYKVGSNTSASMVFGGVGAGLGGAVSHGVSAVGKAFAAHLWNRAPLSIKLMATSNAISGLGANNFFATTGTVAGNVASNIVANSNQ